MHGLNSNGTMNSLDLELLMRGFVGSACKYAWTRLGGNDLVFIDRSIDHAELSPLTHTPSLKQKQKQRTERKRMMPPPPRSSFLRGRR